jgi:hypothetical protein
MAEPRGSSRHLDFSSSLRDLTIVFTPFEPQKGLREVRMNYMIGLMTKYAFLRSPEQKL